MRHAKNCILNKAYTTHEYEQLTQRLIAHMKETAEWGSYFPPELSTFGYNHTSAQDYFPLSKEEALKDGWTWFDEPEVSPRLVGERVPNALSTVGDDVTSKVFICGKTDKQYRIVRQELDLYRKMNLPLPDLSPEARHLSRLQQSSPHEIYARQSSLSGEQVYSSFSSARPEKICSENEFQKIMY